MRDDEIFLCFDCGTKNRIRSGVPGVPPVRKLWRDAAAAGRSAAL